MVVAPDAKGRASGEFYFDDQETLDHLNGTWHKVQFSYEGETLFSAPDESSLFRMPDTSLIEKVMVLGQSTELSQVSVETEFEPESSKVIQYPWGFELRKPYVHVMDRFTI